MVEPRGEDAPRFELLGPLEVTVGDERIPVGGPRQKRLLAALLINAGRPVPVTQLVAAMWDEDPPATAGRQVSNAVAKLRKTLPGAQQLILTDGSGYRLDSTGCTIDSVLFEAGCRRGREQLSLGNIGRAIELFSDALKLWRGPALGGVAGNVLVRSAEHLDEQRLAAYELLIAARLDIGESDSVVPTLLNLTAENPTRESLQRLNMLALYRAGRSAEALRTFERTRHALAEELGVDPGAALSQLHQQILRSDPALDVLPSVAGAERRPARGTTDSARPARLAHLPADLPAFAGRDDELGQLRTLSSPGSPLIVAIDGMPGVGKTALAVRAAHTLAPSFPDGQLFVDLQGFSPGNAPLTPDNVLEGMLRALGVSGGDIPGSTDQRAALYRSCLAGKNMLVVLDNAANEHQVRPLLPGSTTSRVIVTSRLRLAGLDGAELVSLQTLPRTDATTLIARIIGQDRISREDPSVVNTVADLCGDLPLALSVTASRLRARSSWTLGYVVERLRNENRRFAELNAGDRKVNAAFRLSYENLTSPEQTVFRRLGLHPGADFDANSAAALADVQPAEADEVLERLVDMNLLQQHEQGRYRLHDLVRDYVREVVAAEDSATAREEASLRLHERYQILVAAAVAVVMPDAMAGKKGEEIRRDASGQFHSYEDASSWLDAERQSTLAIITAMADAGAHAALARLCASAWRFFDARGYYDDSQKIQALAVASARASGDKVLEYVALQNYGSALWRFERYPEAQECFTEVFSLAGDAGDVPMQCRALGNSALIYWRNGELDEALTRLEWVRTAARALPDPALETRALHKIGVVQWEKAQYPQATATLEFALSSARRLGLLDLQAECLTGLGIVAESTGDHRLTLEHCAAALALATTSGNRHQQAMAHHHLGLAHQALAESGIGTRHLSTALGLYCEIGLSESSDAHRIRAEIAGKSPLATSNPS